MAEINNRIKERRLACGKTLLEVAEYLGVKEATAQRYESGEIKNIKHETIVMLAQLYRLAHFLELSELRDLPDWQK